MKIGEVQRGILKKKVKELAVETDKIAQVIPKGMPEDVQESNKSSSTSLHDSESGYTEHLVEAKFKEVTFKKQAKSAPLQSTYKDRSLRPTSYSPSLYEENDFHLDIPTTPSIIRERKLLSNQTVYLNPSREEAKHKCFELCSSLPSKSSSSGSKVQICKNCMKNTLPKKKNEKFISSNISPRKDVTPRMKNASTKVSDEMVSYVVSSSRKHYHNASVNTEAPKYHNTSLINITCGNEKVQTENLPKMYQVQQLPTVNIRPNLTKQIGPVIDIKVSKQPIKTSNIAVLQYVHPEVLCETKVQKDPSSSRYHRPVSTKNQQNVFTSSNVHITKELKLQRSLKQLLRRLDEKEPQVGNLKNIINSLLCLLNKVVPFHTASIRFQNENLSLIDESIDLFFTNMGIVQEVIDNELSNQPEKFCKYPQNIIKAVSLLCGNIRSIFDISEQPTPTIKHPIKKYIEKEQSSNISPLKTKKKEVKSVPVQAANIEKDSSSVKENTIPKEVYIPYRKLTPGGMYKPQHLEDAESLSDIELRKKRLDKIKQINDQLKAQIEPQKESEDHEQANIQELFNQTFIIDSSDEANENENMQEHFTETEANKKSDGDYEEDFEQDVSSSKLTEDGESLKMQSLLVEAQVHFGDRSEEPLSSSEPSFSMNQTDKSPSSTNQQSEGSKTNSDARETENESNGEENQLQFTSIAIQTDESASNNPQNVNKEIQITSLTQAAKISGVPVADQGINSCPVLRMTNPITNALVEVRLPEQTEKFQSSLHFLKSEKKEEIKLSYNKLIEKTSIDGSEHVIEKEIIKSDDMRKEYDKNEQKESQNDFENITLGFIGFLENKVTEMVNKFKASVTTSEKLFIAKKDLETKPLQYSLHNINIDNSDGMKMNPLIRNSMSSLFSEKSTGELKFSKNALSRGCTPEIEKMKFENLVSPPLALKLKQDTYSQTEPVENTKFTDECVGTSEIMKENYFDGKSEAESQTAPVVTPKKTKETQYDLVSPNVGLKWSSLDKDVKDNLSLNQRLLLQNELRSSSWSKEQITTERFDITQIRPKPTFQKTEMPPTEEAFKTFQLFDDDFKNRITSSLSNGSSEGKESPDEETAIPLSKLNEGGDLQRSSQILNIASMTGSGNGSPHNPLAQDLSNNYNTKQSRNQTSMKNIPENPNNRKSHLDQSKENLTESYGSFKNEEYKEHEHSIFVSGNADPGVELNSKCEGEKVSFFQHSSQNELKEVPDRNGVIETANEQDLRPPEEIINETNKSLTPSVTVEKISENFNKSIPKSFKEIPNLADNTLITDSEANLPIPTDIKLSCLSEEGQPISADEHNTMEKKPNIPINESDGSTTFDAISHNDSYSSISEEVYTLYHYNSDEMSEGEIGFIYTSNSYSSGEIKPVLKFKESSDDILEKNNENNINATSTPKEHPGPSNMNDSTTQDLNSSDGKKEPANLFEFNSSTSVNTGEIQEFLRNDDKLDGSAINKLEFIIDNISLHSERTSPEPMVITEVPAETTHNVMQ